MNNCYFVSTSTETQGAARKVCQAFGSDLVSVHDQAEDEFTITLYVPINCLRHRINLSIVSSLGFTPVGVICTLYIRFQSSYSLYGDVVCTPPPNIPSFPDLGPTQVPFFGSCFGVLGVRMKPKSAQAGV